MSNHILGSINLVLSIDIETHQWNPQFLNKFVKSGLVPNRIDWRIPPKKYISDPEDGVHFVELTEEEHKEPAISGETYEITIISSGVTKTFKKENEEPITVQDVLDYVLEIEQEARPKTDWFGGVDAHHIYFEGLSKQEDGYEVFWGS